MSTTTTAAISVLSRIAYRSFYAFLNLVFVVLLVTTPGDVIRQSIVHSQRYNILVITLSYAISLSIVAFIYAIRLYINRSVLSSIPKSWIPIEKGDVNKDVRKMIVAGLGRSAAIAYEARPRAAPVFSQEGSGLWDATRLGGTGPDEKAEHVPTPKKAATAEDEMGISLPPHKPVWGEIEHPGWAPPTSRDIPNLEYMSVILELPGLIEAKALTLAPLVQDRAGDRPMLDPEAVSLLRRPANSGLRDYLTRLVELHVLDSHPIVPEFLTEYEFARFSNRPVSHSFFTKLMRLFADILQDMSPLDPAAFLDYIDAEPPSDGDIDDDAPRDSSTSNPWTHSGRSSRRGSGSTTSHSTIAGTAEPRLSPSPRRASNSSAHTEGRYRTAPTTPRSRRAAMTRSSSQNTVARGGGAYPASQASSTSLRSDACGSVIRLSDRADQTDLPYVLNPIGMR